MRTLAKAGRFEEVIRRSRFVAHAGRVRNPAETLAFYESVADAGATHNCWAWRVDQQYRFNDDGEPGSSAGRPILAAIEGRRLDQVMVVVTRYYGGIKLGVGGLIRAYGGAAARCIEHCGVVEVSRRAEYRLTVDFALADTLHQLLERFEADKRSESWDGNGLIVDVRLADDRLAPFRAALAEASRGTAVVARRRGGVQSGSRSDTVTPGSDSANAAPTSSDGVK